MDTNGHPAQPHVSVEQSHARHPILPPPCFLPLPLALSRRWQSSQHIILSRMLHRHEQLSPLHCRWLEYRFYLILAEMCPGACQLEGRVCELVGVFSAGASILVLSGTMYSKHN